MEQNLGIKEIWQKDAKHLGIIWTDGHESNLNVVTLRRMCPCASCVDEMTGKRKLKEGDIKESTLPKSIKSVGRYALQIDFNDGHNTGIYSFDHLRYLS